MENTGLSARTPRNPQALQTRFFIGVISELETNNWKAASGI
jgi:hypothetical protein